MVPNNSGLPRLLVLLSRVPAPLDKGDKLRAYHQIKGLSKRFSIILVCLNTQQFKDEQLSKLRECCEHVEIIELNKFGIGLRLIKNVFSKKPFQVAYFYSLNAQKQLDKIIETYLPQLFYCQLIRVAEYARKYVIFEKSIDYMDALSIGMERRIETSNPFLTPFVKAEAKRLHQYEREVFNDFEKKVIISEQDQSLIEHPNRNEIEVIPNGISEHYFNGNPIEKKYDLCFTGNMSYAPNEEGAHYIVKRILPLLNKNIQVLISGTSPSISVRRLAAANVHISGWVEDMRDSYASSKLFVAPMVIGSGLQNKLLEAMACGIPCITTSLANRALGAKHQESILIANSPEEFAQCIEELLSSEEKREQIGSGGREYVRENFSWEKWNQRLFEVIRN